MNEMSPSGVEGCTDLTRMRLETEHQLCRPGMEWEAAYSALNIALVAETCSRIYHTITHLHSAGHALLTRLALTVPVTVLCTVPALPAPAPAPAPALAPE